MNFTETIFHVNRTSTKELRSGDFVLDEDEDLFILTRMNEQLLAVSLGDATVYALEDLRLVTFVPKVTVTADL